jgi:hypothetical protein
LIPFRVNAAACSVGRKKMSTTIFPRPHGTQLGAISFAFAIRNQPTGEIESARKIRTPSSSCNLRHSRMRSKPLVLR